MPNIIKSAALHSKPIVIDYSVTHGAVHIKSAGAVTAADCKHQSDDTHNEKIEEDVLMSARQEAEKIINEAKNNAQKILDNAKFEVEDIKSQASKEGYQIGNQQGQKEGYDFGYSKGLEEGKMSAYTQMKSDIDASSDKIQKMLIAADNDVKQTLLQSEPQIVDTIISVVNKILADEVIRNPDTILPVVKAALAKVCNQDTINVRVHPDQFDILLGAKQELQKLVDKGDNLTITADRTLMLGDCLIDTDSGNVDARLSTQIESISKALKELI